MKKQPKIFVSPKHNQGIVLIISLVFLLLSTLIGIGTLRSNLFNEKMTQNTIQREVALEIAEATLLEGEKFVMDHTNSIISAVFTGERNPATGPQITKLAQSCAAVVDGEGGICGTMEMSSDSPQNSYENWIDIDDPKSLNVWTTKARFRKASDNMKKAYKTNELAQFIVEFMGYYSDAGGVSACKNSPSLSTELANWPYCSLDSPQFRITALARTGNYNETQVMLQSTFIAN